MRSSARTAQPSRSRGWVAAMLAGSLLSGACGQIVTLELPELDAVPRTPPVQSVVYDAEGNRLAVLRREYREPVALDGLADHVIDAVVTAEDRRFFVHGGVDARAVARAALANAVTDGDEQGGSTITQQLVKSLYMPDAPRTPETKLEEALLARQVESELSKEEILEQYLNTVYFGGGAYGIQAAARTYWRIPAAELDLSQAALLAVVIRAPRSLDPTEHPDEARARRNDLLRRMADQGHISDEQAHAATARPLAIEPRPHPPRTREPHWVDLVVRTLLDDPSFGDTEAERVQRLYGGGLRIHTTLDPRIQRAARDVLTDALADTDDPDAAIVAVDPASGHVLAAAGNRAHEQLQFDLPTQAHRQPGSTFKAFVLATAVADGRGPDTTLDGSQRPVDTGTGTWDLDNFDGGSYGQVTLAGATRASINTAYARLALDVGVPRVAGLARAMGIDSPVPDDPMIAIGAGPLAVTPLEMASAFGTLAYLGRHVPPTPVTRIETAEGEVVWRAEDLARPVLEPSAAFVTTQMLRDVVEAGTGLGARVPGWEVAGKTGTTDDHADAWFVGYTTTLAASLWIGHHEGRVPLRVEGIARPTGGSVAAPLWGQFMQRALDGTQPRDFRLPPEAYEVVEIDPETGLLAADWCPGEETPLPRVLVPDQTCPSPPPRPEPRPQPRTATGTPSPSPTPTPSPTPVAPAPSPEGSPTEGESTPSPDEASP